MKILNQTKIPAGWCVQKQNPCPIPNHEYCGPGSNYAACPQFRKVTSINAYEEIDDNGKRRVHLTYPQEYDRTDEDQGLLCHPKTGGAAPDYRGNGDAS